MLEDEQKGVKHPLSGNKLTQMMYSQAKLEKDEDEIKNQTQGASNLSQMSQDDEDEEHTEIEHLEDNEVDENEIGHMTVEEQEIDPQQTHMSTVQSKSGKIKVAKSKLNKTIQKAENLKKKLNQLQALNTDGNEVLKIQAKTPKQAKTLKEIFDEIQFMDNLVKKEVEQETHMINEHQLKKDIRFNSKFLNKKLELDYDLPLVKKPTQKSASEKLGHLDQKKFNNPFKIKKTGGVSHTDKDAEMEKLRIHQEKMREHHDLIKKQIKDIFKGKNQLTKKELHSIENDPFFAHGLFAPPKEAEKPKTADPTKKPVLKDAAPTEEALVPPTKKAVKMEDITKAKGKKAKKTEKKGTQMPPSQEPKMNAPEAVPAPVEAGPNKDEDQVAAEKPKALAHKIIRRKRELDPHNLFHGKTRSQQKLRKLIRGKHHIAQTSAASGYDEEEYDENTQDQEQE